METLTQIVKDVTVGNKLGLHARPAAQIAQLASKYNCALTLVKSDDPAARADCRSILEMLILAASCNAHLKLAAEGDDAAAAVAEISNYFANNFDE